MVPARLGSLSLLVIALSAASACGGAVAGQESDRERLQSQKEEGCSAACAVSTSCGATGACDCACSCPAGQPNCDCTSQCTCQPPTEATCTTRCTEEIDRVLAESPGCEDEMLALLDCATKATCATMDSCRDVDRALSACEEAVDPPPTATIAGGVTCDAAFAAATPAPGPPTDPAVPVPPPGPPPCDYGWDGCSDGARYEVICAPGPNSYACSCVRSGVTESTFAAQMCVQTMPDANANCGWMLH